MCVCVKGTSMEGLVLCVVFQPNLSPFLSSFPFLCRATGGELFRVIAIDPLPEDKAREVVYQIVDGVQHLHSLNIVHLDLKVRGCC